MSRTKPTPDEERELEFICNRCGSPAGNWCRVTGQSWMGPPFNYASELHVLRFYSATRAGRLPVGEQP